MTTPDPLRPSDRRPPAPPPPKHKYPRPQPPDAVGGPSYPAQRQADVPPSAPDTAKPNTYWPLSVVAFLFFFLIGAVGMIFSSQVNSRWKAGDAVGAQKASQTALVVDIIAIIIGFLLLVSSLSGSSTM